MESDRLVSSVERSISSIIGQRRRLYTAIDLLALAYIDVTFVVHFPATQCVPRSMQYHL